MDRRAVVARELTKRFEELVAGPLGQLAGQLMAEPPRGEVTLVVEGRAEEAPAADSDLARRLARALARVEVEPTRAAKVIAEVAGTSRAASYRLTMEEE
jgi:16S rRNA (cytidine1402-2'-O)-methyltransferase